MHRRSFRLVLLLLIFALFLTAAPVAFAQTVSVGITHGSGGNATTSKVDPESGETVTIKAIPERGYRFDHWELVKGNLSLEDEKEEQEIVPEEDVELKAHFVPDVYTVKVEMDDQEGGSFSFYEKEFAPGDEVSITVKPYEGFQFVKWTSLDVELANASEHTLTFTMPRQNVTLTAFFDLITYRFRVVSGGGGTAGVEGLRPNRSGEYECKYGDEIELLAEANDNYLFSGWTATNGAHVTTPDSPSTSLICPASDFTVRAQFASAIKDLTVTSTEGGSVSPQEGKLRLGVENIMELFAVPEEGYVFSKWECSSEEGRFSDPKSASATFTMPDADCTVTAVFIKGGYKLTILPTVGGRVNESAAGNYEMNEQVPLIATPEEGYEFSRWESTVKGVVWDESAAETVATIPGKDVKITAVFTLKGSGAAGGVSDHDSDPGSGFPWAALIVVLLLSAAAIGLIIVRERYNLSYRYLIKKWMRNLFHREDDES